jgi:hypothetical protein
MDGLPLDDEAVASQGGLAGSPTVHLSRYDSVDKQLEPARIPDGFKMMIGSFFLERQNSRRHKTPN